MTRSHYDQTVGPLGLPEVLDFKASLVHARNILLVEKCERLATVWYFEGNGEAIYEKVNLLDYFYQYGEEHNPYHFFKPIFTEHFEYFTIEDLDIDEDTVRVFFSDELSLNLGCFYYDFGEFALQFVRALVRNLPDGHGISTHAMKTRLLGEPDNKPER